MGHAQSYAWLPQSAQSDGRSFRCITDVLDNAALRRQARRCAAEGGPFEHTEVVVVRLQVGTDGRAYRASLVGSTLENVDVARCLMTQVSDWSSAPVRNRPSMSDRSGSCP